MQRMSVALPAFFLLALFGAEPQAAAQNTELAPVTKVVLYKHGMGYFEREGKVKGNAALSLAFRAEQMKDLLASFFAVDLGGGKIVSVRYDTSEPASKQLEDILIKAPEDAALSQFLMQLKGARLTAKAAGEIIVGRILGLEPITEVVNSQALNKGYRLVLLTDAGPIRSVDLFAVSEFSLDDEALQRDLRRLLDLSLAGKRSDRKKLTVSAVGQGERGLRIGYLIEMPIWKCSYRVIFDEKKKDAPALVQGWALAENNTEDDWKDVAISFVAGNPMSYVMDLYSPYYVKRARVPIPGLQNLAVDWGATSTPDLSKAQVEAPYLGGVTQEQKVPRAAMVKPNYAKSKPGVGPASMPPPPGMPQAQVMDQKPEKPLGELLASAYDQEAQGVKLGELFKYEPKEKVSIPRGQAAMIPILSKPITGPRLLYYKASFLPKAANAFVLRNDTDLTLEAGAVTFFEGGSSLGEGILGHTLAPGSQEVIPYAVDASVDVKSEERNRKEPTFKARLVDGILALTAVETVTSTWKILNRGKEPATLWLHQPKHTGYKLSKPEKPLKEVDNDYRFEVPLKPGETTDFAVEEKRDVQETVRLADSNSEQIRFYISQPYISAGGKVFMKDLSGLMARKADLERQVKEWNQQTQRLTEEQTRLRSNLQALLSNQPKEQELRAKWVAALSTNEDQLAGLRANIDNNGAKIREMEEALAKKIREYKDE